MSEVQTVEYLTMGELSERIGASYGERERLGGILRAARLYPALSGRNYLLDVSLVEQAREALARYRGEGPGCVRIVGGRPRSAKVRPVRIPLAPSVARAATAAGRNWNVFIRRNSAGYFGEIYPFGQTRPAPASYRTPAYGVDRIRGPEAAVDACLLWLGALDAAVHRPAIGGTSDAQTEGMHPDPATPGGPEDPVPGLS